jgi:threonyl-tRNA synthetase
MKELEQQGIRVKIDLRNEKIGFKIREHSMQRVPYLVIVGDKELEDQTITVRTQKGEDLGSLSISQFTERLKQEIADRK